MEKKEKGFYWKLFKATFSISAFTIGGGAVIVPLMQKKFVEELGWIEQEEMMDMVAIGQSAPGAMAVNTSVIVGYRLAGIPGALFTVLGTVLPPLVILSIISLFYAEFAANKYVAAALKGMQAGVAAVMIQVAYKMAKNVVSMKKKIYIIMMLICGVLAIYFQINIIYIILACGLFGAVMAIMESRREKKK